MVRPNRCNIKGTFLDKILHCPHGSTPPSRRFTQYGDAVAEDNVLHITEYEDDDLSKAELVFKYRAFIEGHEDKDLLDLIFRDIKNRGIVLQREH